MIEPSADRAAPFGWMEAYTVLDEAAIDRLSEETTEKYRRHVNPGIAGILNFSGFSVPEERAQGCNILDASGR